MAALVVAMLVPAAPALAQGGPQVIVCSGVTTTTYDPPLTHAVRTTNRTTTEELLCVPLSGMPFTGARTEAVRGAMSCPIPADPQGSRTYRYNWDNDNPPNSSVVKSVGYPGERMTSRSGTVIGGRYKNYAFIQVTDEIGPFSCDNAGLASTTRRTTVTFTAP